MSVFRFAAIAVIGLSLAACASNPEMDSGPKETTGNVAGAIGGAAIGSQFGGGTSGHVAGALIGAGLGALIGNRIGAALDDEDKQRAYAAQMDALEHAPSGAPVSWKNPDSGRYGTIVPGPTRQEAGRNCRSFTHTIYIDGRPQTARGTACRNPDGTWTSVG
jgi:surface antigen